MTYQEVYDSCLDTPYIPSEDGSHFDRRHYFYMKQNPDLLKNAFEIKSKQTEQPFSTERDNFKEKLKTFMKMTKQLKTLVKIRLICKEHSREICQKNHLT